MTLPVIRRIEKGDGVLLRELRLRALQTDPDAFGSTYSAEVDRADHAWEERSIRAAEGARQFIALAMSGEIPIGMVGGYQPEEALHIRELYGMWVAPEARSTGVGFDLVRTMVEWAQSSGARSIRLWVVTSNRVALALYRKAGFGETGRRQPLPSNPSLDEIELSLSLV